MAFRDSWHSALVYFGLAEEYHDDYEEPGARPRPRSRIATASGPTSAACAAAATSSTTSSPRTTPPRQPPAAGVDAGRSTTVLKPVASRGNGDVRVHLVVPKSFNDAQQIADKFKDSIPVILNLQSSDTDLSKRLIDFASGSPTRSTAACSGSPTRSSC